MLEENIHEAKKKIMLFINSFTKNIHLLIRLHCHWVMTTSQRIHSSSVIWLTVDNTLCLSLQILVVLLAFFLLFSTQNTVIRAFQ